VPQVIDTYVLYSFLFYFLVLLVSFVLMTHVYTFFELLSDIVKILEETGMRPDLLELEITETMIMNHIDIAAEKAAAMKALGVKLAIDDFGTGYSSLSYLRQLPAKELKIDRSFVSDLKSSGDARAVVDAVVRLAHALGLRVVAEGVETVSQRDILLALGCDELQGFLFARPMSADDLTSWVRGGAGDAARGTSILGERAPANA